MSCLRQDGRVFLLPYAGLDSEPLAYLLFTGTLDTTPARFETNGAELSVKNSGLLSLSTRDWWCDFWS